MCGRRGERWLLDQRRVALAQVLRPERFTEGVLTMNHANGTVPAYRLVPARLSGTVPLQAGHHSRAQRLDLRDSLVEPHLAPSQHLKSCPGWDDIG
jgi:hypothetical protein